MKIAIFAVTYKSYDILQPFVSSIDLAAKNCPDAEVTIAIGDNTDQDWQSMALCADHVNLKLYDYHQNFGYLGCAFKMLNDMREKGQFDYDFVAISNVDVCISSDFFLRLREMDTNGIGWIAPDVYTPSKGTHESPFMLYRPGAKSFKKWKLLFFSPLLYGIYDNLAHFRKRSRKNPSEALDIYAGHGSFMLFTSQFIQQYKHFEFPSFMYAEEIFFAELIRNVGLKVQYEPNLHVDSVGSVSVSVLGHSWKCKQNRESLKIIYETFFRS